MTASEDIETQWNNLVWSDSDIQAITTKIHTFPITELSEREISAAYYNNEINFIEALTTRAQKHLSSAATLGGVIQYDFSVVVNYYRQFDTTGANYIAVRDAFETIFSTVLSGLGNKWNNTVDYWRPQEGTADISQVRIDDVQTWRGTYRYLATKAITA